MKQNKKQVKDAIDYFEGMGFIQDLTTDKKYYAQILVDYAKENINMHRDEVSKAKQILKKAGYQTVMFKVSDITDNFYCPKDMANKILDEVYSEMDGDIWNGIVCKCILYGIQLKD